MMDDEFWAPVPNYQGIYEVSTLGNFRRADTGRAVAVSIHPRNGYGYVHLSKAGIAQNFRAHRLVLWAHVGLPPGNEEARHLNGTRSDNRLCNLAWGTAKENNEDRARHGTLRGAHAGSRHHNAKLTEDAVEAIFNQRAAGMYHKDIAAFWGISPSNVCTILKGRTWKHVSENANRRVEARL